MNGEEKVWQEVEHIKASDNNNFNFNGDGSSSCNDKLQCSEAINLKVMNESNKSNHKNISSTTTFCDLECASSGASSQKINLLENDENQAKNSIKTNGISDNFEVSYLMEK